MTDEDKDPEDVQVINPPNLIKTKVSGGGGPSNAMLERAEEAINRPSDDYPMWAMKDVDKMCGLMDEAEQVTKRVSTTSADLQTGTRHARPGRQFRLSSDDTGRQLAVPVYRRAGQPGRTRHESRPRLCRCAARGDRQPGQGDGDAIGREIAH